jgi:pimeloyl-ACP methyl ester carboxylesterase
MATKNLTRTGLLPACVLAVLLASSATDASSHVGASHASVTHARAIHPPSMAPLPEVAPAQSVTITYRAHDGRLRSAIVLLPHDYSGAAPLPLIISPHGRGLNGALNARLWGDLPTLGHFAVVNPDGEGRLLGPYSWGWAGQISDLARMPAIVAASLPWVRIDRTRIYAVGGSMGGQETLLLLARYPRLLAGAVAVDSLVDFARQYRNFPHLDCDRQCRKRFGNLGKGKQRVARKEVGGTPSANPAAYAERSPLTYAAAIARSCVPLQIWWTRKDKIVMQPELQSGAMFRAILRENQNAAEEEYIGSWKHTKSLNVRTRLPMMLAGLGLLPSSYIVEAPGLEHEGHSGQTHCANK